jgi:hypothetical protein
LEFAFSRAILKSLFCLVSARTILRFHSTQKLLTTLRILSEMPQAQALTKPDFISERIQLNEARLTEATIEAMGFANAASYY